MGGYALSEALIFAYSGL